MSFKPSRSSGPRRNAPPKPARPGAAPKPAPFKKDRPAKPSDDPESGPRKPTIKKTGEAKPAKAGDKAVKTAAKPMSGGGLRRFINVYLSLGSNIEDRRSNLRAVSLLIEKEIGKIAKKSHLYETQPWGKTDQAAFLNQVVMVNTTLDPRDLLDKITLVERELGRDRHEKWGPRTVDVDILFYGKRIVRDRGLEIPHPELHKRAFVLVPLLEIAPDLEHPIMNMAIDQLYMDCTDMSEVVMLDY